MCSQEVWPESVFLFKIIFAVIETVFDSSNTSLKSFVYVCSQEVGPETVFLLKFIKNELCQLWLKLCLIGRTRV